MSLVKYLGLILFLMGFAACTDDRRGGDTQPGGQTQESQPDSCQDGERKMKDCNSCTCMEGRWACTLENCADDICQGEQQRIEAAILDMRACSTHADCTETSVLESCPFGCGLIINRDADFEPLRQKITDTCQSCDYDCSYDASYGSRCVEGLCEAIAPQCHCMSSPIKDSPAQAAYQQCMADLNARQRQEQDVAGPRCHPP